MTLRNGNGCMAFVVAPFLTVWVLGWTAGTIVFDAVVAKAVYRQARTTDFAVTQGRVLLSKVDVEHDEGTTYSVRVKYDFEVAGRRYESTQFRYQQQGGSRRWTHETVGKLPVGGPVTVYYDPADPSQSVLMPGLAMCDLLATIFLLPFNMVMLGVWAAIFSTLKSGWTAELPAWTRVLETAQGQTVRFPGASPVIAAGCASGGVAFVLIFILGFLFEMHGPLWPAMVGWVLILAAGGVAGAWAQARLTSGEFDLLIDEMRQTVTLPGAPDFQPRKTAAFAELASTNVAVETTKDSDGDETKKYTTQLVGRDGRRLDIYTWTSEADARKVAVWLATRLGIEAAAATPV